MKRVSAAAGAMKYVFVLLAIAARAAIADGATCDAHTAAELRNVFAVAVGLNDAYRHAASGSETPEHAELRAKLADYDEHWALPCAATAAELLRASPDALLGRSLLELVSSRERAESPSLARSLARFLDSRPDDFLNALANMPTSHRCPLVATAESGWAGAERAAGDGLVANLKRAYCRAAKPEPTVKSPNNRARDQSDTERRQSRPRLARAERGNPWQPANVSVIADVGVSAV